MKNLKIFFKLLFFAILFSASTWAACSGSNIDTWTNNGSILTYNDSDVVQSDNIKYYTITVTTNGDLNLTIDNTDRSQKLTPILYPDGTCSGTPIWTPGEIGSRRNATSGLISVTPGTYILHLTGSSSHSDTDFDFDGIYTPAMPPVMGDIPDKQIESGTAYSLDISSYVTTTNGDPILSYALTGTIPAGLSFDTTSGLLNGTPTVNGTYDLNATATDKDGISNSDLFTLTIITINHNADDVCYGEITGGCAMFIVMCNTSTEINSLSDEDLTDVELFFDTTSLFKMFGSCSVDNGTEGENCSNESNYAFGPASMFGQGTSYDLGDRMTTDDQNHSVQQGAMFDMGAFFGSGGAIYATYIKGGELYTGKIYACSSYAELEFYDQGRVDAVDKYATDGHTIGMGLKTRVEQKSYAPDTSTNPNLYSVDAVYLGVDETNPEIYDAANMPVFFYLVDDDCTNPERLKGDNGESLTAVIQTDAISGTTPAFTLTEAQRSKRLAMRYIDYKALYTDSAQECLKHSSTGANAVPGLPSCVSSNTQYLDAFHQEAYDRCKVGHGEPCKPNHHGYSCGESDTSCPGYDERYDHPYGCYECTLGQSPGVCSSDNFAIRPKDFLLDITHPHYPHLLRAGQDYNISLTARDESASTSDDYNITDHNWMNDLNTSTIKYFKDGTEDTAGLLQGTAEVNTSTTAYSVAGLSSIATSGPATSGTADHIIPISYSDVGLINLQIYDSKWAAIDDDDTNTTTCDNTIPHTRICGDLNVTFIPHHFAFAELNITNHAGPDSNFTYVANNRGMPSAILPIRSPMAARVQTQIQALTQDGSITQNFRKDTVSETYYENNISVNLSVTIPSTGLNSYLYPDANESNITNKLVGFGRTTGIETDDLGTRNIKWDESSYPLEFNFQRKFNKISNPFDVNGSSFSISILSIYSQTISGTTTLADINGSRIGDNNTSTCMAPPTGSCIQLNAENNATFYYAKTKPSQSLYDDVRVSPVNTPIIINIYCNPAEVQCEDWGIPATSRTGEFDWWLSVKHDMSASTSYGNIELMVGNVTPSGSPTVTQAPSVTITSTSDAKDENVQVAANGTTPRPMTVEIDFVTNDILSDYTHAWLIYNQDKDEIPSPFYKVRFIGQSGWAGHGPTGFVVDSNVSTKKNRRLGW